MNALGSVMVRIAVLVNRKPFAQYTVCQKHQMSGMHVCGFCGMFPQQLGQGPQGQGWSPLMLMVGANTHAEIKI